jgi:spore maturation protein CgeB
MTERLLLVGNRGGSNIAASLERAAQAAGHEVELLEPALAMAAPAIVRRVNWWLRGRRPTWLGWFGEELLRRQAAKDLATVVVTGVTPPGAAAIQELGRRGVRTVSYLTDDPWSPDHRAPWFLDTLPAYDVVFTTRRANLVDLRRLGVRDARWLPFGWDPALWFPEPSEHRAVDVLFVGGAEPERVPFLLALRQAGLSVQVYGSGWGRYRDVRALSGGQADVTTIRRATTSCRLSLCLVRHRNRDGHVMRTFEIPAMNACVLAEDTEEHRELLGEEAPSFRSLGELVERARALLGDDDRRRAIAASVRARVSAGGHRYADRLGALLAGRSP